tara:strand:- start:212 stop:376 length:165 start_codon:yes stop_codon:yes gene_type:complete
VIDLAELEQVATSPGRSAVIGKAWLRQALRELREGRECLERQGRVFGLPPGERL